MLRATFAGVFSMWCFTRALIWITTILGSMNCVAHAEIEVVLATGDPSPDGNGVFAEFLNPSLNDAGQFAILAVLDNTVARGR